MKFSQAMLKGYKTNGGKQCVGLLHDKATGEMCVMGAVCKGRFGDPIEGWAYEDIAAFRKEWGLDPISLNNGYESENSEMFPWEHIYGMARAIGL